MRDGSQHAFRRWAWTSIVMGLLLVTSQSYAYSSNTIISEPCHEQMTQAALKRARALVGEVDVVPAENDRDHALLDDLPFPLDSDLHDISAAALVLSNRYSDFRGHEPTDLTELAPLHGAEDHQEEHCLRQHDQQGISGSKAALEACRRFIRARTERALAGLDSDGSVDRSDSTELDVNLTIRGQVGIELPTYHVHMGRALHALQDSFSHTYRTEDHMQVVTVLNYVEVVEDSLNVETDGPPHRTKLDACNGLDELRSERLRVAHRASMELLAATLGPGVTRQEKLSRVDALLDKYLTHVDGCDASNDWCDAPEAAYAKQTACAWTAGSVDERSAWGSCLGLLGLSWLRRRQRGARTPSTASTARSEHLAVSLGLPLIVAATLFAPTTHAQSFESDATASTTLAPAPFETDATPWGIAAVASGAITEPALAGSVGGRYRINEHWVVGIDAEYNPWFAETTKEFRPGVTSLYATNILRYPIQARRTNLRTTVQLGASYMMFDLVGIPKGTIGPFLGVSLLGIDFEMADQTYLIVNPAQIAVPIPQSTGAPFAYTQYRLALGLQFGA